mmetsp:Transcript_114523/g.329063  ORF Transcript_114523/g.329063 Transcript_114523/m.329063 type:complete len:211 (-) Transcript_114523:791-1423(-)
MLFKLRMCSTMSMTTGSGSRPASTILRILSSESHTLFTCARHWGARSCASRCLQMLFLSDTGNSLTSSMSPAASLFSATTLKTCNLCSTSRSKMRMRSRTSQSLQVMRSAARSWHNSKTNMALRAALRLSCFSGRMPSTRIRAACNLTARDSGSMSTLNTGSSIHTLKCAVPMLSPPDDLNFTAGLGFVRRLASRLVTQRHSSASSEAMA